MESYASENSPFYDNNNETNHVTVVNNKSSSVISPSPLSNKSFVSQTSPNYNQFLPPDISIFLPHTKSLSNSPSDCSFDSFSNAIATQNRLNQASCILENQQFYNNYTLCIAALHESIKELDALREENDNLRLANAELISLLSLKNCLLSTNPPHSNRLPIPNAVKAAPSVSVSPTSVIPKSISVRSTGTRNRNRAHFTSSPRNVSQRGEEAVELEVYNQGMEKTELCNKWQETGTCPYGGNCQFAHGIGELRPVIRHPRYKTEVCRMVLSGEMCPYGHRCHFRHSLTDQEKLQGRGHC